jgi:RNA polymerase sigma factor (sigma-70 family)
MLTLIEQQLIPDVTKASAGDIPSFERLIQRCRQTVTGIALAIVKDLDASEEVAQQVFIHVWQQLGTLREPASFLPWVRQITRYRAYNYLRDNRVNQQVVGEEAELLLAQFADPTAEVADNLQRDQQNLLIQQLIDGLPEDSREIVLLYYREEQSSQQVAELLGLSDANVRKKLSRVRELLKEQLLSRYGNLLLSTAPGIGFSAMLASLLVTASPPAAAAGAAFAASGSSTANVSWLGKLGLLLSGAMIGALAGIAGVYFGMQAVLKNAKDEPERVALRRIRNQTIAWVVFSGVLLTLGYEMTSSAWGPLGAFALLLIGLVFFNLRVAKLIGPRLAEEARQDPALARRHFKNRIGGLIGAAIGFILGAAGLIYNMYEIGRL